MAWSSEFLALAIALGANGPVTNCPGDSQHPQSSIQDVTSDEVVAISSSAIKITSIDLNLATCCSGNPAQFSLAASDGHVLTASSIGVDRQLIGFDDDEQPIIANRLYLSFPDAMHPGQSYTLEGLDQRPAITNVTYNPDGVTGAIQVNQVGYVPTEWKFAYVGDWLGTAGPLPVSARHFELMNSAGAVVYKGPLALRSGRDPWSGNDVYEADFSAFRLPGCYRLRIENLGMSDAFTIGFNVYADVSRRVLRLLYHSRNSTPIESPWADSGYERQGGIPAILDGVFAPGVGDSPLGRGEQSGGYHPVSRGWFDAGDYGQYIPNAAPIWFSVGLAFDLKPNRFRDGDLGIPESGNGIPDLIDELEWGMDWALSMQDTDGGVYFRIASKRWDSGMPAEVSAPRLIAEKTTHATAVFAAMAAIHARLIATWRPERAVALTTAAESAWRFATNRPQWPVEGETYRNSKGMHAGEYSDPSAADALLWAAAELFRTTGRDIYKDEYEQRVESIHLDPTGQVSFRDQGMAAVWAYLMSPWPDRNPDMITAARNAIIAGADWRIRQSSAHPFRSAMHPMIRLTGWGSFAHSTRATASLLQSYYLTADARYLRWAWVTPNAQLGANPQALSYITGIGTRSPHHPLSKLSKYDGVAKPLSGIPVNGPHYHLPSIWPSTRAVNTAYLPSEDETGDTGSSTYPALRRYTDSDLLPPMNEPTVAEITTTGIAYALLSGSPMKLPEIDKPPR